MKSQIQHIRILKAIKAALLVFAMSFVVQHASATTKTAIASGNLSNPNTWSPTGTPSAGDILVIPTGKTVSTDVSITIDKLQIQSGGRLNVENNKTITIAGEIHIDGTMNVYEGDVVCPNAGTPVSLGPQGLMVWEPANKTSAGATFFTNGIENLHPTSTLVINHWYNYSNTPLGSVITGSFGNLTISTLYNGMLFEWDQKNSFATHPVLGTLTIDQGWVVLDKTGQATLLNIGAIRLLNENSHLDVHSGTHNGNITLNTASFENNGGTFNGVLNGAANFNMHVIGNLENKGDFRLIFNNGQSTSNSGNASLLVDGTFKHIDGDFRGLFNISTMQAGTVTIETGAANIDGGVFIAHYAMHRNNGSVTMKTNGKLTIKADDASDIFRVGGLTSIGTNICSIGSDWLVNGPLEINGHVNSEITSSVSTGPEQVTVHGKTTILNGKTAFNLGSHPTLLRFNGAFEVAGGQTYLCKTSGALDGMISGNVVVSGGTLNIRGGNGSGSFIINGAYQQTGGELNLFNNLSESAITPVELTLNGTFSLSNGKVRFNTNPLSTEGHQLFLNGTSINFGSGGIITTETYANAPALGSLHYGRSGTSEIRFSDPNFLLQNTRQIIDPGTTLKLMQGKMVCASLNNPFGDALVVEGVLDLNGMRIGSNKRASYSGMTIVDGGVIRISHSDGLYGSATNTAIDMQGNFGYTLALNSLVEYCGDGNQTLSGIGEGQANSTSHRYGILKINKSGGRAKPNYSNVYVRSQLQLENGILDLSNHNLQIEGNNSNRIIHTNGAIISESGQMGLQGQVVIKNVTIGIIEIPFARDDNSSHLFKFEAVSGNGDLSVSTVHTNADNNPKPTGVSNLNIGSETNAGAWMTDRWYHVKADGIVAKITIGFDTDEAQSHPDFAAASTSVLRWNGNAWGTAGTHQNSNGNHATASGVNQFGYMVAAIDPQRFIAGILDFKGELKNEDVQLVWTSRPNRLVDKFIAERSSDGINFTAVLERNATNDTNTVHTYNGTDTSPLPGRSYYRIREMGTDGTPRFTSKVTIDRAGLNSP
ncbi:MAG: G8 domain-containing protein, partial [Bacteroidota bacterium]